MGYAGSQFHRGPSYLQDPLTPLSPGVFGEAFGSFDFDDLCYEGEPPFWDGCPIFFDPDYLYAWDDMEQYQEEQLPLVDSFDKGGGPFTDLSRFFDPDYFYAWDNFDQYPNGPFDGSLNFGGGIWAPSIHGVVFDLEYYMATMDFLDEANGPVTVVTSDGNDNPFDTGLWAGDGIIFEPS